MLIKQSDYNRIFRVSTSLLGNENANPAIASIYFSTFGAFILGHHFKVEARPTGGLAAYNLGGKRILFADHRADGYVTGAGENFHCWIEAEGWAIDFMAPAFPAAVPELAVPAKMLQRPLDVMAPTINDLEQSGDFFYSAAPKAMSERFADWRKQPLIGDLAIVAASWFRKALKAMRPTISARDRNGKANPVTLVGSALVGSW